MNPDIRCLNGLETYRYEAPGWRRWVQRIERSPLSSVSFDKATGQCITVITNREPIALLDLTECPRQQVRAKFQKATPWEPSRWAECDPREPDPLQDEIDRARELGLTKLVDLVVRHLKIEPRQAIGGFDLGRCWVHSSAGGLVGRADAGELLRRHAQSERSWRAEAGEISPDDCWCPPLAQSQAAKNVIALAEDFGVVRSEFHLPGDPSRRSKNPWDCGPGADLTVAIETYLDGEQPPQTFLEARASNPAAAVVGPTPPLHRSVNFPA